MARQGGGEAGVRNGGIAAKGSAKRVTPLKRQRGHADANDAPEPNTDFEVTDEELNEILLVCGVIGSTSVKVDPSTGRHVEQFVPQEACLQWLQDLQRVIRRDRDTGRPISLKLGHMRVVGQKLLPLAIGCRYDRAMVQTVCKILVLLTKPLSKNTKNAGTLIIDVKSGKVEDSVIKEQKKLRKNAIAQSDQLMEYKKLFVRHASHHYAFQSTQPDKAGERTERKGGTGLLSVFASLLAEPLSKTGSSRTSSDHLTIELVLQLILNLLSITPVSTFGSAQKSQQASQLHRELLILLKEELVLDVLICVGQEVERRENQAYNLFLMEILSYLLRGEDPSDVAFAAIEPPQLSLAPAAMSKTKGKPSRTKRVLCMTTTRMADVHGTNFLKAHLQSERNKLQYSASSRHSHFGGTLMVTKSSGRQGYVSATNYLAQKSLPGGAGAGSSGIVQPTRRKNRRAEVFVGSGKSIALNSRLGASAAVSREVGGPTARRSKLVLNAFCAKFMEDCYGPVMKSLKNEFRRDSSRLEDGDKIMFFKVVWFFHQWWRVDNENKKKRKEPLPKDTSAGSNKPRKVQEGARNLIFTMDVFMFNLVLNSTDEFLEHKKPAALAQTVSLYTEMIRTIRAMYDLEDSTEQTMALGLMDRLFYAPEPLDRLPKLLSRWTPGMFSREYLCDLVEVTHVLWGLLDANAERCLQSVPADGSERKRPKDAVERMDQAASEFDKDHFFMKRFVSHQIIFMYTQLLSQYAVNAAHINRHIVAYFIRLCKFVINGIGSQADVGFDDDLGKTELEAKQSTFEPLLYNINLFIVLEKVLNDTTIRGNPDFEALIMFASSFLRRFSRAAEANPMLYVEAMFRHPVPHRFCELSANLYANEELRMIAVRDALLEDQRQYESQEAERMGECGVTSNDIKVEPMRHEDEDEEELEFNCDDESSESILLKKRRRKPRQRHASRSKKEFNENESEEISTKVDGQCQNKDAVDVCADGNSGTHILRSISDDVCPSLDTPSSNEGVRPDVGVSSKLIGKKRFRKSTEAEVGGEDSDEDFFTPAAPSVKATRRFIIDDDEDDN